jgi:hypothetical protein
MPGPTSRALIIVIVCAAVLAIALRAHRAAAGDGEISPGIRAATLNLAGVAPEDRAWIQSAIATARPEAQRLIAEIDGVVKIDTSLNQPGSSLPSVPGGAIGLMIPTGGNVIVALDVKRLNGDRAIDRNMVVLHELGHVIDLLLVDDKLIDRLDAGIPASRECPEAWDGAVSCTAVQERFADTFAKWALRGRFSIAGSGYGVPTPASLEDWGMPLGALAIQLDMPR